MNYNQINPMQLINMIQGGVNPQQLALSMLAEAAPQNPMMQNLLQMAQQGDTQNIEQFARNMVGESGKDYDEEFKRFRQQTGL